MCRLPAQANRLPPLTACHTGAPPPAPVAPAPPPSPVSRKQIRITGHIRGDPTLPVKRPLPVHVPDDAAELDAAALSSSSDNAAAAALQMDVGADGSSDVIGEYDEEEEDLDSPMMIGNEEASLVGASPAVANPATLPHELAALEEHAHNAQSSLR